MPDLLNKIWNSDFIQKWRAFLSLLLDPWSLMLLFVTGALFYVSNFLPTSQTDKVIVATLSVLFALSSGILGGRLMNRWEEITGEKVLIARGRTAIRSLTLLVNNVTALRKRVTKYLERHTDEDHNDQVTSEVIRTYLEEVIDRCAHLETEALSAIDNWQDVIPEANVDSQIEVYKEFEQKQVRLLAEVAELRSESSATKESEERR